MTNDRHVRIYADGRTESLDALGEMWVYSQDANESERQKAHEDFLARNQAVREMLGRKGFQRFRNREGDKVPTPRQQREWIEKRNEATRIFHETRDATLAEDIGLFPPKPRRLWLHKGLVFHVSRTSDDSTYIGLRCDSHNFHAVYMIGLTGDEKALLIGQVSSETPKYRVYSLEEALERGANLLIQDCLMGAEYFSKQLDEFFAPEHLSNAGELDEETDNAN